ncbi:MAG: hypothetical protein K8S23_00565 [Candidatus Cloacimonetes bacterium]|nr:hypothetical protein [Candidatus Cloacimonadota bacterium]
MSGPKFFRVDVFNKDLNDIFQLQSRIQCLIDELSQLSVDDIERNIHFDCLEFIDKQQSKIRKSLSTFNINFTGKIKQGKYDKYQDDLESKKKELRLFIKTANDVKNKFKSRREDYKAYLEYELFYHHSIESFDLFKTQVISYLKSYLKKDSLNFFKNAEKLIKTTEIGVDKAKFELDFKNIKSQKQKELQIKISDCESLINDIRKNFSNKVSATSNKNLLISSQINFTKLPNFNENEREVRNKIDKIDNYICKINNSNRKKYKKKLTKLIQSQSLKGIYYYNELFDEIRKAEKIYCWKTEIQKILSEIDDKIKIHEHIKSEKNNLIKDCLSLIKKGELKIYEYEDIKIKMINLKKKNEKAFKDDFIKAKENQFLKEQLINSLESMNYKVMTDMKVIDFEKESDFLFNIPKQNNYLNLRFEKDGSFYYNFLIPERKDKLNSDQKSKKFAEMGKTCNEFKELLAKLSSLGLNINKNSEISISEDVLIQVPEEHRDKIEQKDAITNKAEAQKVNYLDK